MRGTERLADRSKPLTIAGAATVADDSLQSTDDLFQSDVSDEERLLRKREEEARRSRERSKAYYHKHKDDPAFKEKNAAKTREWVANNPDRKKAADAAYYQANREKIIANNNTPECHARNKQWRLDNLESERAKGRERMRDYKDRVVQARENGDPDGIYADYKRRGARTLPTWRKNNPEAFRAQIANRAARERNAEGFHTGEDIARIKRQQRNKCGYCRCSLKGGYHVDHIVALAKGGTNWPNNIQLLCEVCSTRKNDKDALVFARKLGKLL